MLPLLLSVIANENKTLILEYDNGEKRLFDVKPYIKGSWYGELNQEDYFKLIKITSNGKGIAWPHGQDIAPHELYELSVLI